MTTPDELRDELRNRIDLVIASACLAGILVTSDVRTLAPDPPLLVLADSFDPAVEADFLRAGATGVLNVRSSCDDVTKAAATLLAGRTIISTEAVRLLATTERSKSALTPRQTEILEALSHGKSTDEIADAMFVTPSTVKTHIGRLALRFGLSGRRELAVRAADLLAEHR